MRVAILRRENSPRPKNQRRQKKMATRVQTSTRQPQRPSQMQPSLRKTPPMPRSASPRAILRPSIRLQACHAKAAPHAPLPNTCHACRSQRRSSFSSLCSRGKLCCGQARSRTGHRRQGVGRRGQWPPERPRQAVEHGHPFFRQTGFSRENRLEGLRK